MIKYRFEVTYQTKPLKLASEFLNKCDLNTGELCLKDVITFKYISDEKPIQYFKDLLTQAMNMCDIHVVNIEGGKIE